MQVQELWDRAVFALGTSKVFETRMAGLDTRLMVLGYIGAAVPALVGAMVLSFGAKSLEIPGVLLIVGLLGVGQFAISLWSTFARWPERLSYATESMMENAQLANEFERAAKLIGNGQAYTDLAALVAKDDARQGQDQKRPLSEPEKRFAMRSALLQFRRPCVECSETPTVIDPSDCAVCGNFQLPKWSKGWAIGA